MEKDYYFLLDKLLIDDCKLILKNYSSIYYLCKKANIKSIGELLRKYDDGELSIYNRSHEEISGVIDLIKYRYFDKKLSQEELLFDEITYMPNSWKGKYHDHFSESILNTSKFKNPLKRLGFTLDESETLLYYVTDNKQSMVIINAILKYRNDGLRKKLPKSKQEIFDFKLDVIIDYYYNNCFSEKSIEIKKYIELENLLIKLSEILNEREKIDKNIKLLETQIDNKKQFVNDEDVKVLLKRYNKINCKVD